MNTWLRYCDKSPEEIYAPDDEDFERPIGWSIAVLAIRSDGYMYHASVRTDREPVGRELEVIRFECRKFLDTMLEETPPGIATNPSPETFMKGIVYQNGDAWVESEPCLASA